MAKRRTYGDACGISRALDLVGERWALMVVRELVLGPKRFSDLRAGLPLVSPDVLTQRLRDLVAAGILARRKLPPPVSAQVYELTAWGAELEPVLASLGRWGARAPAPPEGAGMSFDAHVLTLRSLFEPSRADGVEATFALLLGEQAFLARIAHAEVRVHRGAAPGADASISGTAGAFVDVLHGRRTLADAESAGELALGGDTALGGEFLTWFPLPEPASGPV